MTKEELEKEAEEIYIKTDKEFMDCQDEGEIFNLGYIAGAEPREKRIEVLEDLLDECGKSTKELVKENAELKGEVNKAKKIIFNLLSFENDLDHYMYECDDAQNGELLKPFREARDFISQFVCKKCNGEGYTFSKKWGNKIDCPSCKGVGYAFLSEVENE